MLIAGSAGNRKQETGNITIVQLHYCSFPRSVFHCYTIYYNYPWLEKRPCVCPGTCFHWHWVGRLAAHWRHRFDSHRFTVTGAMSRKEIPKEKVKTDKQQKLCISACGCCIVLQMCTLWRRCNTLLNLPGSLQDVVTRFEYASKC